METKDLKRYPPVVTYEENDGAFYYRASFKEFPNMIGGIGQTVEEAISAAYDMLDAEIAYCEEEGISIPKPFVSPLSKEASGRITLRMGKALHRQAIELAEEDDISLNSLINEALSRYVEARSLGISTVLVAIPHPQELVEWPTTSVLEMKVEASDKLPGFGIPSILPWLTRV